MLRKTILLAAALAALAAFAVVAGCSSDIEVERTKLPHIDKPMDLDAAKDKEKDK